MSSSIQLQEIQFGDFEDGEVLQILKKDCTAVQIYWERVEPAYENSDHGSSGPTGEQTSPDENVYSGDAAAAQPVWTGSEWTGVTTMFSLDGSRAAEAESRVPHDHSSHHTPSPEIAPPPKDPAGTSYAHGDAYYPKPADQFMELSMPTSDSQNNPDYIVSQSHISMTQPTHGTHYSQSEITDMTYPDSSIPAYPHRHQYDTDHYRQDNFRSNEVHMNDPYRTYDHGYGPTQDVRHPTSKLYEKTYERRNKKKRPRDYYAEKFGTPDAPHMAGRYMEGYDMMLHGSNIRNQIYAANAQPGILGMAPGMIPYPPTGYIVDTSVPPPGMLPVDINNIHRMNLQHGYKQTAIHMHNQTYPSSNMSNVYRQNSQDIQYNDISQNEHVHGSQDNDTSHMYIHDAHNGLGGRLQAPPGLQNQHLNVTEAVSDPTVTVTSMVTVDQSGSHTTMTHVHSGVHVTHLMHYPQPVVTTSDICHMQPMVTPAHQNVSQLTKEQTAYINQSNGHRTLTEVSSGQPFIKASQNQPELSSDQAHQTEEIHPVPSAPPMTEETYRDINTEPLSTEHESLSFNSSDQWQSTDNVQNIASDTDEGFSFLGELLPSVDSQISNENKDNVQNEYNTEVKAESVKESLPTAQPQSFETPEVPTAHVPEKAEEESPVPTSQETNISNEITPTETERKAESSITKVEDTAPKVEAAVPKPEPLSEATQKPTTSWAGLFKKNAPSTGIVVYNYDAPATTDKPGEERQGSQEKDTSKDSLPQTVPTAEDKAAKQLGEFLVDYKLNHKSVSLQPRGLVNRANWCYVNATLQAMLACPPFYHLLKALSAVRTNDGSPSSTPVMDSLVQFVAEFSTMPPLKGQDRGSGNKGNRMPIDLPLGSPFEPSYVYKMLQVIQYDAAFKQGRQEDAEEFLSCLLNGLHEEMVAATKFANDENGITEAKPNGEMVPSPSGASLEEEEEEEEEDGNHGNDDQWEQVGPKNKSVITRAANFQKSPAWEIFGGQIRSLLHKQGLKESATLQPFYTLQLDIQNEKVFTLKDALDALVSKESIHGFTCSKTKKEVEASRRITLEELPAVLVLHLKCMVYDSKSGGIQKIFKKIDFDVNLDINKDLLSPSARSRYSQNQRQYKLLAVVSHHGSRAVGGHYTTDYFHPGLNGWVQADDSNIKLVTLPSVLKFVPSRVPYLILYRRADLI